MPGCMRMGKLDFCLVGIGNETVGLNRGGA